MAYFVNGYPYSDTHNLNLDWVIDTLKRIETEIGQIQDGLEIHVTDTNGVEIYTFTVKANGIYITRTDSGTPFFYNYDSQTLHAPYFDGQSFLFASGRTTGQMRAGSLVLDTPLSIAQGGTGVGSDGYLTRLNATLSVTPTSIAERFTIAYNNCCVLFGKLAVIQLRLSVIAGTRIPANTQILTFDKHVYTPENPGETSSVLALTANQNRIFTLTKSGSIASPTEFTADFAGNLMIGGCFLVDN